MFILVQKIQNLYIVDLLNREFSADFMLPYKDTFYKAFFIDDPDQLIALKRTIGTNFSAYPDGSIKDANNNIIASGKEVNWPYDSNNNFIGNSFK